MKLPASNATMFLFILYLAACTTTKTQEAIKSLQPGGQDEAVVLLADASDQENYRDDKVEDCLGDGMREVNPQLRIVPAPTFRTLLYPYFSTSTSPHTPENYQAIFNKPVIQRRIAALGIRYLVVQSKANTSNDKHGGILCGGGGPGAGCFGLSWYDRKSEFEAKVWDLKQGSLKGTVQTQSTGTGIIPALLLPFPLYLPATESASCQELGSRLAKAIIRKP
jgi:hypothetical protein